MTRSILCLTWLMLSVGVGASCGRGEATPDPRPSKTTEQSEATDIDAGPTTRPADSAPKPEKIPSLTAAEYEAIAKVNPQLADLAKTNPAIAEAVRQTDVKISPPIHRAPDYTEEQLHIDNQVYLDTWNDYFDLPRVKTLMAYVDRHEVTNIWPPASRLKTPVTRDIAAEFQSAKLQHIDIRGTMVSHLFQADHFLQQKDPIKIRIGLEIAHYVAVENMRHTKDHDLALIIADLYLFPYIKHAWPERSGYASRPLVLGTLHATYLHHKKYDQLITLWQWARDHAKDRIEADNARLKLAQLYEQTRQYEKAITQIRAIDPKGPLAGVIPLIKSLEKKAAKQSGGDRRDN